MPQTARSKEGPTLQLTLILVTYQRNTTLDTCLRSLESGTAIPDRIILFDLNPHKGAYSTVAAHQHILPISYINTARKAKSVLLNRAIGMCQADVLVFTDDDCIVDPDWISNIRSVFTNHPSLGGAFGRTMPWNPKSHPGKICPCTQSRLTSKTTATPVFHESFLGYGNNMAIRKHTLEKTSGFRHWLSPGSIMGSGEDADIAFQILLKGVPLRYEPKMLVFHNRWLTPKEARAQSMVYARSETACYSLYAFRGNGVARGIVKKGFREDWDNLVSAWSSPAGTRFREKIARLYWPIRSLSNRVIGAGAGAFHHISASLFVTPA